MDARDLIVSSVRQRDMESIVSAMFIDDHTSIRPTFCTETELWDYKLICPQISSEKLEWAEMCKDVLAFHNTGKGGVIIFGVSDTDFSIVGVDQNERMDSKLFNDKIRKYVGDTFWIEYFSFKLKNEKYLSAIIIPPCVGEIKKFVKNGPEKHGSNQVLFCEGGAAIRKNDSTQTLTPKEANEFNLEKYIPSYKLLEVDDKSYKLLSRDYHEFINRKLYCSEILKGLNYARAAVVTLTGIGGVGKTALATWAVRDAYKKNQFDYIVSMTAKDRELNAGGIQSMSPMISNFNDLLDNILDVIDLGDYKSEATEKKERIVRELISKSNMLIFVDNLETISDIKIINFLNDLPEGVKAIVTSRRNLVKISSYPIEIDVFSQAEISALITSLSMIESTSYCKSLSESEKGQIGASCNRIPLVVKWTINRSKSTDELLSAVEKLDRSNLENAELLEFSFRRLFDEMTNTEKRIMQVLSLFFDLTEEALIEGCGLQKSGIVLDAIEILVRDGIISKIYDNSVNSYKYKLLTLTKSFIIGYAITSDEEKEIRKRLKRWFEAEDIRNPDDRKIYQEMRQNGKNIGDAIVILAYSCVKDGDDKNALRFFEKAIERDPKNWKVYRAFADYYRHEKNSVSQSIKYFQLALQTVGTDCINQEVAVLHREYAMVYSASGERNAISEAIMHLQIAHTAMPNDPITAKVLSSIYISKSQYSKAVELLEPFALILNNRTQKEVWPLLEKAYRHQGSKYLVKQKELITKMQIAKIQPTQ